MMITIKKLQWLLLTTSILATLIVPDAVGQEAQIPGTVQPGQIEKQLKPPPQIPRSIERVLPSPTPIEAAPDLTEKLKFIVRKIQVDGTSIYSETDLTPYFAKYLHKTVSVAQIQNLADELTTKYRNDGYILSQVIIQPSTLRRGLYGYKQ